MWIRLLRRAPTRAGTSLVKGGLLGPGLTAGHERTNEWMRLGCRTPPPPLDCATAGTPCFVLEVSGRSPGRDWYAMSRLSEVWSIHGGSEWWR